MADDFVTKSDLASTAHSKGASTVGVEDASGRIVADNVEDALQEIITIAQDAAAGVGTKATSAQLLSNAPGAGASLIGIQDAGNNFSGGNVELALAQVANTSEDHETRIAFNETDITTLFEEVGAKVTATDLSSTAHGSGASQVGIQDAAGLFSSNTVEGALHELAVSGGGGGGGGDVTLAILASHAHNEGASLIGIEDSGSLYAATQTEGALAEVMGKANTGIANAATAQTTANAAAPSATLASTSLGQGASLVGIHDTAGIITATTVEGATAEIAANVLLRPLTTDLASTLINKGASLFGINDAGGAFTSTQVEAALQELAGKSPPTGFFDIHADNKARYAAPYGDDANDGRSWYTPKQTVLAAYDDLPVGGSMYIMDNTYIGGEVPGQGLWLTGALARNVAAIGTDNVVGSTRTWTIAGGNFSAADIGGSILVSGAANPGNNGGFTIASVTNPTTIVTTGGTNVDETFTTSVLVIVFQPLIDANLYPGWRFGKTANWYGVGSFSENFAWPCARMLRGRPGDVTKPSVRYDVGMWVTATTTAMTFNNLCVLDFGIGCRIGCTANPDEDPDVIRGSNPWTTAMVLFNQCGWQSNVAGDHGQGPVVDMGYFLWVYFNQCAANAGALYAAPAMDINDDRHALWLSKPSDGTSMFQLEHCRGSQGGIIYYNGPSTWGFNVYDLLIESDGHALPPLFKAIGLNQFGNGYLNTVLAADDFGSEPRFVLQDTQATFLPTSLVAINCAGNQAPCINQGADESGNFVQALTPAGAGQMGFMGNRIVGNSDIGRWASPLISNRYKSLIPQRSGTGGDTGAIVNPPALDHSANRVWTQKGVDPTGGGTVVNAAIKDHTGGENGIRIGTSDGSAAFQRFFFTTRPVVVGDYFIMGAWMRFPSDPGPGSIFQLVLTNGDLVPPTHILDRSSEVIPTYKGNGEWSWVQGYSKITSLGVTTDANVNLVVNGYPGQPTDLSGITLLHLHAADVAENEIGELLQNMQSWLSIPTGVATTQPGQAIVAQGGLGVGNSIPSGITLSSTTRLMEVFNEFGAPLGFLEIKQEVVPGAPKIYFDAQNIDALNNSTLIDGDLLSTWKNVGSLGAAADLAAVVDIFGDHKPTYRQFAADGKIKNQSCVTGIGVPEMQSPVFAAITQPYTVVALFRNSEAPDANPHGLVDAGGGAALIKFAPSTYDLILNAGTLVDTGIVPVQDQFHTVAFTFDGASSTGSLDTTTTGTIDTGANSLTQIGVFNEPGGANYFRGDLVALLVYDDGTSIATIKAFLARKYGATPQ